MITRKIVKLYQKYFYSLEKQAIFAGVRIGKNNFIASKFWSSEGYLIAIGNNCQITAGVKFFTHGGGGAIRKEYPKFDCFGKVTIGDYVYIGNNSLIMPGITIGNNVWIGANCAILPGVTIGDNVTIGAGSVVNRDIPSNTVAVGNPCRVIKNI